MASLSHRSSVKSTDRGTQTADLESPNRKSVSPRVSPRLQPIQLGDKEEEKLPKSTEAQSSPKATQTTEIAQSPPPEVDYTKIDLSALGTLTKNNSQDFDGTTVGESPSASFEDDERRKSIDSVSDLDSDDEEPVIFEVASTQATIITPRAMKVQGGLVDIPKRGPPPPLPPRSSARNSRNVDGGSARSSPLKDSFDEVDLNGGALTPDHRRDSFLSVSSAQAPAIPPRQRNFMSTEEKEERTLAHTASRPVSPVVIREADKQDTEEKEEFHSLPPTPGAVPVR